MASVVARAKAASSAAASVSREGLPSVAVHQGGGQKKEAKAKAKGKGKAKAKAKAKAKVRPEEVAAARPKLLPGKPIGDVVDDAEENDDEEEDFLIRASGK